MALQVEPVNSITPTVFQTALHPDKEKEQWPLDLKSLSADAFLFFAAGETRKLLLVECIKWLTKTTRNRYNGPHTDDRHLVPIK